jgi:hypothetical protein
VSAPDRRADRLDDDYLATRLRHALLLFFTTVLKLSWSPSTGLELICGNEWESPARA